MTINYLSFDQVNEVTLQSLVSESVAESKSLEYKQDIQIQTDEQKREFLSDITAMANTDGGDIVYGIREDNGVASEVIGLRNFNQDNVLGQIENILRDAVQPRLSGIQYHVITLSNGNSALILRISRSFSSPHMVRHRGVTRFCGRNANGKYDLDAGELRSAFLASEGLSDRLKSFRIDRVNRLISGDYPCLLVSKHLVVLHILPVASARPDMKLSSTELQSVDGGKLRPIGSHGWNPGFNFDGRIANASLGRPSEGYVQLFRNGFIESVDSSILNPERTGDPSHKEIIPSIAWESQIIEVIPSYISILEALNIQPPYVVSISLVNVKGFRMYVDPRFCGSGTHPIAKDYLLTDEIVLEAKGIPHATTLKPLFDQVWNACGWHGSLNYQEDGSWNNRR